MWVHHGACCVFCLFCYSFRTRYSQNWPIIGVVNPPGPGGGDRAASLGVSMSPFKKKPNWLLFVGLKTDLNEYVPVGLFLHLLLDVQLQSDTLLTGKCNTSQRITSSHMASCDPLNRFKYLTSIHVAYY